MSVGPECEPSGPASSRATVVQVSAAVVALALLSMGRFLGPTTADVLLHSLASTERLTFYYWGQDRLANLVALVASPVQDPVWNLWVVLFVQGVAFHALLAIVVVFAARASDIELRPGPTVVAVLAAGYAVGWMLTPFTMHTFVIQQQYAMSLALFLAGLALVMRASAAWAVVVGAVMILAAVLVIPATVLFLPLAAVVGRSFDRRRVALGVIACVGAFVIATILPSIVYDGATSSSYRTFSRSLLSAGWRPAWSNIVDGFRTVPTIVVLATSIAVLVARRRQLPFAVRAVLVGAPPFALAWFCTFTANRWVADNLYGPRYYFPVYAVAIIVVAIAAIVAADWVRQALADRVGSHSTPSRQRSLPGRKWRTVAITGTACALTAAIGLAGVADDGIPVVDAALPAAATAEELDVEVVVGDYWGVWPVVYASHRRGHEVFGLTYRGEAQASEMRAAVDRALTDPDDDVTLMCVGLDATGCVAEFDRFADGTWAVVSVDDEEPLTLTVRPV